MHEAKWAPNRLACRLVDANQEGRIDANYTLLSLLSIEIWCRRFIDAAG
jgi:hypothetical protein